MKTLPSMLAFALLLVSLSAPGQQGGTISFSNLDVIHLINAPFFDSDNATRLAGDNYRASLYIGPVGTPTEFFVRVGPAQPFRTGTSAGYWQPVNIQIPPGVLPGAPILAQVRFWDTQGGTLVTLEEAQGSGAKIGFSLVLQLNLLPSGTTPLTGLRSASLQAPVSISAIANRIINQNGSTGPIPFTLSGYSSSTVAVNATSSNPSLIRADSFSFAGTGSNRSVAITPLLDQSGTATITLTARNASGGTASTSFLITVVPVNDIMRLHIVRETTNTTVTWTATNGVLQHSLGIVGEWADVLPEAKSPYKTSGELPAFYRLRRR
jgi:hypothetical protein